jgi:hypothetical protein
MRTRFGDTNLLQYIKGLWKVSLKFTDFSTEPNVALFLKNNEGTFKDFFVRQQSSGGHCELDVIVELLKSAKNLKSLLLSHTYDTDGTGTADMIEGKRDGSPA